MTRPQHEADDDSFKSAELATHSRREKRIRAGEIEPRTDEERQWRDEGPVQPSRYGSARGPQRREDGTYRAEAAQ